MYCGLARDPGHGAGIRDGGCCFDDDDYDEDTSNDFFGEYCCLSVCYRSSY